MTSLAERRRGDCSWPSKGPGFTAAVLGQTYLPRYVYSVAIRAPKSASMEWQQRLYFYLLFGEQYLAGVGAEELHGTRNVLITLESLDYR